jgi:hypothetical protein
LIFQKFNILVSRKVVREVFSSAPINQSLGFASCLKLVVRLVL